MKEMQKLIRVAAIAACGFFLFADSRYEAPKASVEVVENIIELDSEKEEDVNIEIEIEKLIVNITTETIESAVPDIVYTTKKVNIRYEANLEADILVTVAIGTKLTRIETNTVDGWDTILVNNTKYYVANDYITTEVPEEEAKDIQEQIEDAKISATDLRYMSAIIYAEAGTQCEAGQQAVGIVVKNREESTIYKDTIREVIYESGQFTPVTNGALDRALALYDSKSLPDSCIEAAIYALQGNKTVYYNGNTYDLTGFYCFSRYVENAKVIIQEHMFK